ncbi:MAG: hypothetical protein MJ252_20455 [archaeon]|nr:hypothetical protein [archaeon]
MNFQNENVNYSNQFNNFSQFDSNIVGNSNGINNIPFQKPPKFFPVNQKPFLQNNQFLTNMDDKENFCSMGNFQKTQFNQGNCLMNVQQQKNIFQQNPQQKTFSNGFQTQYGPNPIQVNQMKNEGDTAMNIETEDLNSTIVDSSYVPSTISNPREILEFSNAPKEDFKGMEGKSNLGMDEYFQENFLNLLKGETLNMPTYGYMNHQLDINPKMRAVLIDWLSQVHLKYKLVPETLFLTVNIIDRFLEKNNLMRNKLQLVGVSALLIASKYEDIFPPTVSDLEYISDNAFRRDDIINMENTILNTLSFEIVVCSSYKFLEFYKIILGLDEHSYYFAWYLIELALVCYDMLKYKQSLIAASACLIASKFTNRCEFQVTTTGYTEEEMVPCCRDLLSLVYHAHDGDLTAIYKKFSSQKFHCIAKEAQH